MFNLDDITIKNDNKDWPYRTLVIGSSGSGKTNCLLNKVQTDNNIVDKIYLYANDIEEPKYRLLIRKREQEPKYRLLIKKREQAGIQNLQDKNGLIEYSNSLMIFMTLMIIIKKEKEKF